MIRLESSSTRGSVCLPFPPSFLLFYASCPPLPWPKVAFSCSSTWFCICQSCLLCFGQDALPVFLPPCLFWSLSCNFCLQSAAVQACLCCFDGYVAHCTKCLYVVLGCAVAVLQNTCVLVVVLFKCPYIWVPGKLILTIPRLIHLQLSQSFSTSAALATDLALYYYYL